ncbi:Peroxiredoxin [Haloplanus vescus]|uniref:thioredoxin-dependent peroxiredoxin n=1 Tax=Haloplanus vescus TaxID=555874 RepID=A0A1H3ZE97_9EURY|nr:redoxin domain-containing protein [Haloplanus vescus]SEA21731.1 Peroxiredoxin [Haloplanus vescus]
MVDFDVVPLPDADHVAEGEQAPDFTRPLVNDEFWEDASLSDLTDEGPVCLVFYPMDGAFPATYIWNELRDREWDDHLTVVGVSISTPYAHKQLVEEREMPYDLFADPSNEVAEAYGVAHDLDGMAGVSEPRPAVFLLDEDRTVQHAWVAEEWPDFPPYDDLEAEIRALAE